LFAVERVSRVETSQVEFGL